MKTAVSPRGEDWLPSLLENLTDERYAKKFLRAAKRETRATYLLALRYVSQARLIAYERNNTNRTPAAESLVTAPVSVRQGGASPAEARAALRTRVPRIKPRGE